MTFQRAERKRAKARIGLCAPAGAGKTHGALLFASGLGNKIALIDTENGSAELEAGKPNIPEFDTLRLQAPFEPRKYIEAIKLAESEGYDVIIIDSLSHCWAGSGGLLDKQMAVAQEAKENSYTAWRKITPLHNELIDTILQSSCHIIGTMRSKTEYLIDSDDNGKVKGIKKIGLAPVQREGMDYEFTVVFDIDQKTHKATCSKDRTIFDGVDPFKISKETGLLLKEWLESGKEEVKVNRDELFNSLLELCNKAGKTPVEIAEITSKAKKMTDAQFVEYLSKIKTAMNGVSHD